jgi:hypothetical protein
MRKAALVKDQNKSIPIRTITSVGNHSKIGSG